MMHIASEEKLHLLVLEVGRALLEESLHALLLILGRESREEELTFIVETFGERELVGLVDTVLSDGNDRLRVGRNLSSEGQSLLNEVRLGDDLRNKTVLLGGGGIDAVTSENEFHGLRLAESASEALSSSNSGDGTELDLRLAELGVGTGVDDITAHRQFATSSKSKAVDSSDDRLLDLTDIIPSVELLDDLHVIGRHGRHFGNISSSGKSLRAARNNDRTDLNILLEDLQGLVEFIDEGVIKRVELLGAVEGNQANLSTLLSNDVLIGSLSLIWQQKDSFRK